MCNLRVPPKIYSLLNIKNVRDVPLCLKVSSSYATTQKPPPLKKLTGGLVEEDKEMEKSDFKN